MAPSLPFHGPGLLPPHPSNQSSIHQAAPTASLVMLRKHLPMHCKQAGKMSNHSTCMLLCNFVMCQTESVLSSLSNKSRVGLLANTCSHARLQIGLFPARGQFPCAQPALHLWDSQVKAGSGGYRGSHLRRVPQRDAGSGAWHLAPAHTHTHAHAHTHTHSQHCISGMAWRRQAASPFQSSLHGWPY